MRSLGNMLAALVLAPSLAIAAAPPRSDAVKLPVATFTLKNGLTVLVSEDHAIPVVAVEVLYHVGSKEEKRGKTGFAHLFEHMMFEGSGHVGDKLHFKYIAEAGGTATGTTNTDRTNFFETVPSNYLARALWLESDRMGFLLDTLTQAKLDNQRDVVRNERRQSYENRPYGMVPKALHEMIYPEGHPYRWLTIGEHSDLEAASLEDVKSFFRTWYSPSNATLALAGDVTLADAKQLAQKYFGDLPSRPAPPQASAPKVVLSEDKRERIEDKVSLERLYLSWPSPPLFAPGDAELDLLATLLSSKSGRLYERLVYRDRVAQSVECYQESAKLGSLFEIVATARPGHTAAEIEKIIDEELRALLGDRPVTAEELGRARNRWEAAFVFGLQGVASRASRIGEYYAMTGRADFLDQDRRRYLTATPAAVERVAREVLGGHKAILTVVPIAGAATEKPLAANGQPIGAMPPTVENKFPKAPSGKAMDKSSPARGTLENKEIH